MKTVEYKRNAELQAERVREKMKEWVRSRPDLAKPVAEELKSTVYPCYYDDFVGEEP